MFEMLQKHDSETLYKPDFFERRMSKAVGHEFVQVKPVAQFKDDVQLKYNVGTRSNGVDAARWPEDLTTEIVRSKAREAVLILSINEGFDHESAPQSPTSRTAPRCTAYNVSPLAVSEADVLAFGSLCTLPSW